MSKQEQMKYVPPKESSQQHEYTAQEAAEQAAEDAKRQKVARKAGELATETTDELLDEIDEILELSEETVLNFKQSGGQAMFILPMGAASLYTTLWVSGILVVLWMLKRNGYLSKNTLVTGFQRVVGFGRKNVFGSLARVERVEE